MIGVLPSAVSSAPAGDVAFTVANYPVEATAQDAVAAKEKAHAEGQQAAFRSLLKRIVPVTAYNRLMRLKSVKAAGFLEGIAVRSERNSSTEYIASLDFSFQAQAVRDLLRREGVPYIDEQATPLVLVPVVINAQGSADVTATASWAETWRGLDLQHTVTPAKVEALRPVIHADTLRALREGSGSADRILSGEYRADLVIAAIAEIDQSTNRLHLTLAGTDAVGPISLRRSYRLSSDGVGYAMELAANIALGTLEGRWKAVKVSAWGGVDVLAGPGVAVDMQILFASLSQWNEIRQQLLETRGVEDLRVNGVSARSAEVSLLFPGGAQQLADVLAPRGLSLRNTGAGWFLRSSF